MTAHLTWQELATLKPGALVAFGVSFPASSMAGPLDVPVGCVCSVVEMNLADGGEWMVLRPVNAADREHLVYQQDKWNGTLVFDLCDGLPPRDDIDWSDPSPFVLEEIRQHCNHVAEYYAHLISSLENNSYEYRQLRQQQLDYEMAASTAGWLLREVVNDSCPVECI